MCYVCIGHQPSLLGTDACEVYQRRALSTQPRSLYRPSPSQHHLCAVHNSRVFLLNVYQEHPGGGGDEAPPSEPTPPYNPSYGAADAAPPTYNQEQTSGLYIHASL